MQKIRADLQINFPERPESRAAALKNTRISFRRKMTVADRRRLTAQLWLTNSYDHEALATELTERWGFVTSESIVRSDLLYVRKLQEAVAGRTMAEWTRIELEKLDHLENMVMQGAGLKVAAEAIDADKDMDLVAAIEEAESSVIGIDAKTADTLLKIGERRTRLLGLDAPKKIAVEGGDPNKPIKVSDLTDEAIEAFLLANKPQVN